NYWHDYYSCPSCMPQSFLNYRLDQRFFPVMTLLAATGLLVAVLLAPRWRSLARPEPLAVMMCVLSIVDLFYISNTQWRYPPVGGGIRRDAFASLISFAEPRRFDAALADPGRPHSIGLVGGWGFIRHEHFFLQYFEADGAARQDIPRDQVAAAR